MCCVLEFILSLKEAYVLPALRRACATATRSISLTILLGLSCSSGRGDDLHHIIRLAYAPWGHSYFTRSKTIRTFDRGDFVEYSRSLLVSVVKSARLVQRNPIIQSSEFVGCGLSAWLG
jgi:hypothetical protein